MAYIVWETDGWEHHEHPCAFNNALFKTPVSSMVARMQRVTRAPFGVLHSGAPVELVTLTNAHGSELRVITFGGIIVSLKVPDRYGQLDDVVLGYDSLVDYLHSSSYFGAIVGRYANRIAYGRFTLDGETYHLATNDGPHHLHGGVCGFDKVVWQADCFEEPDRVGVVLTHTSHEGDEGYPGTLSARVAYVLTNQNTLAVDYSATTDRATPINLSQHSYFNLAGAGHGDVLGHELMLDATHYAPIDATCIPTGEIAPVAGTPFDFRVTTSIGARIRENDQQLRHGLGYDHHFILNRHGPGLMHAARVTEPISGRTLDLHTTQPGLQLYTGNFLAGDIRGKNGRIYDHRGGFCLETQHAPNSPNTPQFPSTILRPGETYTTRTIFVFGTG